MARSNGGGLPWKGSPIITPGTSDQDLFGQYNHGIVQGDPDLVSGNIRAGVSIFGVSGDPNVIDTQTATPAAASDIRSGKVAFANGSQITGAFSQEVLYDSSDMRTAGGGALVNPTDIGTVNTDTVIASATLTLNKTSNVRVIAIFVVKTRLSSGTLTMKIKRGGTTLASQNHSGTIATAYTLTVVESSLAPGTYTWDAVGNSNDSGNDVAACIVAFSWVP